MPLHQSYRVLQTICLEVLQTICLEVLQTICLEVYLISYLIQISEIQDYPMTAVFFSLSEKHIGQKLSRFCFYFLESHLSQKALKFLSQLFCLYEEET